MTVSGTGPKSTFSSPRSCIASRYWRMSETRPDTTRRSGSWLMPRISRASRLSIRLRSSMRDDVQALASVGREAGRQPVDIAARVVGSAVRLQRQAAAVLLGRLEREPVVLAQGDGDLAELRLLVVGPAAVEERHATRGSRPRGASARPALERPAGEGRDRSPVVDADRLLHRAPQRPVSQAPVGDRRHRSAKPARQRGTSEDPVTQLKPWVAFSFTRAWVLISAMCTPCGHTWVQIPQPEQ